MTRLEFLQLVHAISDTDLQAIEESLITKTYKKGTYILRPGEVQKSLFFVKSGVQAVVYEKDGKNHVLAFTYYPNLCSIPDSFPYQRPSQYGYLSLADSELDLLSFNDLEDLCRQHPEIEILFRKINYKLLVGFLQQQVELRTLSIEERFRAFSNRSSHLFTSISHKYIASYLNIDATNFSKLFNSIKI